MGNIVVWDLKECKFIRNFQVRHMGNNGSDTDPVGFVRPGEFLFIFDRKYKAMGITDETEGLLEIYDIRKGSLISSKYQDVITKDKVYEGNVHRSSRTFGVSFDNPIIPILDSKIGLCYDAYGRMHVVDLPSNKILLSLMWFRDNTWIVHTPTGTWFGSEDVEKNLAFYRGTELLELSEARKLKNPEQIRHYWAEIRKAHLLN